MRVITKSAIDISESLAAYMLAGYLYRKHDVDPRFEKRLSYVETGKFSIADVYYQPKDMAIEVKSIAHGNSALKGVVQASMYKEQTDNSAFVMQEPRRPTLKEKIEEFSKSHGVGVVWIVGVPQICSKDTIEEATGGTGKPFELWKKTRYKLTKEAIIDRSRTSMVTDYLDTIEQVVEAKKDEIFEFAVSPDSTIGGFSEIY